MLCTITPLNSEPYASVYFSILAQLIKVYFKRETLDLGFYTALKLPIILPPRNAASRYKANSLGMRTI
jgi:hypothetical protein